MTYLILFRPSRRRMRQLGASAVEVAIILAAIIFPLVAVVDALEDNASGQITGDGNRVGTPAEVSNQVVTVSTTAPASTSSTPSGSTTSTTTATTTTKKGKGPKK